MDFAAVLKAFDELASKHHLRYALVGGLGLAAYGIVRMTLDIDFIVERLPILVPRAEHLIAMKVLAIKNDASRTLQELADIGALITTGGLDMNEIRQYFVLHGLEEKLEEIIRTL